MGGPGRYTDNGQWRGIEDYTRRITKPSQVLGQTDGAAQALVRYAECRALLGGTTTSQGITMASAGGLTKFYAGLIRNAEAPDDPRLSRANTNIANPVSGNAVGYLEKLMANICYLQHLSEGTDAAARGWFHRLRIDANTWETRRLPSIMTSTHTPMPGWEFLKLVVLRVLAPHGTSGVSTVAHVLSSKECSGDV